MHYLRKLRNDLDQVSRHTHGSDIATGTGTLNDEGVAAVALSVEADDVVASLESSDGV